MAERILIRHDEEGTFVLFPDNHSPSESEQVSVYEGDVDWTTREPVQAMADSRPATEDERADILEELRAYWGDLDDIQIVEEL